MNPGFDRTNLTAAHILLPAVRYPEPSQAAEFYSQALENLRRDNGVESAALVQTLPLSGESNLIAVRVEGHSDSRQDTLAGSMIVSPGYFQTLRIPLVAGRDFNEVQDHAKSEGVAVVNESFARLYWPGDRLPLGRRVQAGGGEGGNAAWLTVVGVVRDVRHVTISDPPRPEIYRPHSQVPERNIMLVARSRASGQQTTGAAAAVIRSSIWQVDREQPIFRLQSVEGIVSGRNPGARATT
jgi:putative ABC transport system permease protein